MASAPKIIQKSMLKTKKHTRKPNNPNKKGVAFQDEKKTLQKNNEKNTSHLISPNSRFKKISNKISKNPITQLKKNKNGLKKIPSLSLMAWQLKSPTTCEETSQPWSYEKGAHGLGKLRKGFGGWGINTFTLFWRGAGPTNTISWNECNCNF